ncbi:MAG: hypothetical protein JW829_12220 [Pirellulales bacterium]|nr:hypothetical protein [Pirellulales bacterium]
MADSAIKLFDKNGDNILDSQELVATPGLQSAVAKAKEQSPDVNGDGKLSRDEIRDHIALFESSKLGIQLISVTVLLDRQPLAGARVTLEPEPFLEGVLESASDTTRQDGTARPAMEIEDMKGVRPGIYRVKITHPDRPIPPRYNDNTTLGLDLAPARAGYGAQMPVFQLESK